MGHLQDRTSFDDSLVLSDTQTLTASGVGTDTTPTAIELDVTDHKGQPIAFNISVDSVDNGDADETYQADVEYSDDNFSTVRTAGQIVIDRDSADNSHFQVLTGVPQELTGATIEARVNFTLGGTTPSLVVDKAWLAPGKP